MQTSQSNRQVRQAYGVLTPLASREFIILPSCGQTAATGLQIHEYLPVDVGLDGRWHDLRRADGVPAR
jgi:hypothetical protein